MDTSIEKIAEIAQDQIDKETASDPLMKTAIQIVEKFIKTNRVMCYGGTAINNILPEDVQFYDKDIELPDYDFYSDIILFYDIIIMTFVYDIIIVDLL